MTTDPFATQERFPSLSFKDAPIGTTYKFTVYEDPQTVQSRDFDTGEPAFWPDGNKKLSVVTILEVEGLGMRSLWAPKPSAMFRALADAQQAAGAQIKKGGTGTITFTGEQPNERNPKLNPQKLYKVTYVPNDPFGADGQVNTTTGEVQPRWTDQPNSVGQPAPPMNPHPGPQNTPKQHTPEVLAALANVGITAEQAANIDPANIPTVLAALSK